MDEAAGDIRDLAPGDRVRPGERVGPGFDGVACRDCGAVFRVPAGLGNTALRCTCGAVFPVGDPSAPAASSSGSPGPSTLMMFSMPEGGEEKGGGEGGPAPVSDEAPTIVSSPAPSGGAAGTPPVTRAEAGSRDPSSAAARPAGKRFGRYELLEEIGRGGMGAVFRARQEGLNRQVALKMLLAGEGASEEQVRRFRREAESAAKLSHPNIVPIFDVGEVDGCHYYTMEFVRGESAAQVLERMKTLPAREALRIARETAHALHFAHENGILHRDVKPGNILLAPRGGSRGPDASSEGLRFASSAGPDYRVLVADFGLAKDMGSDSRLTASGAALGTPAYMSPEQADGDLKAMGPWSDVYSLGAVLYEMVTGVPPFQGSSVGQILAQVATKDPVPPRKRLPGLHKDVETVILAAMAKEPARRYPTARAMAEDIERYLRGEAILARPAGPLYRASKFIRRNKLLTAAFALLAAVLAVAVVENRVEASRRDREVNGRASALVAGARRLVEERKFLEAENAFAAAQALVPGLPEAEDGKRAAKVARMLARAGELLAEKDWKAAGLFLEEAAQVEPGHPEIPRLLRVQKGTATLAVSGAVEGLRVWFARSEAALPILSELLTPPDPHRESGFLEEFPAGPFGPHDLPFGGGILLLSDRAGAEAFHLPIARSADVRVSRAVVRVDPSGAAGPKTPAEALAAAGPGTVIEVPAGVHEGALRIERPGVVLRAAAGARPVIRASEGPVVEGSGAWGLRVEGLALESARGSVVQLTGCRGAVLLGNRVSGGTADMVLLRECPGSVVAGNEVCDGKEAGIKLVLSDRSLVAGNHVHHVGWCGIVSENNEICIGANRVHDNSRGGIYVLNGKYADVFDNVVGAHPEWGILAGEKTTGVRVENNFVQGVGMGATGRQFSGGIVASRTVRSAVRHNTLYANRVGIEMSQSPETTAFDNLVVGSTTCGIHWHEAGNVDYNALWDNRLFAQWIEKPVRNLAELATVYDWKGEKMAHGLESDPGLVDPAKGDFRLKPDSPCRGAGSDKRDIGADPAKLKRVAEGAFDRASWCRRHLVRCFDRLAANAEAANDPARARALCVQGLAFEPKSGGLKARLTKLEGKR